MRVLCKSVEDDFAGKDEEKVLVVTILEVEVNRPVQRLLSERKPRPRDEAEVEEVFRLEGWLGEDVSHDGGRKG